MNILWKVKTFSFEYLTYEDEFYPCYKVKLRCVFDYKGSTYRKLYTAYYVEETDKKLISSPYVLCYKSWMIEIPYLSFSTKRENRRIKKEIRRSLFLFLDELETTRILPLEEKNKPILSKIWIKKDYDDVYDVNFLLRKHGGTYTAEVRANTFFVHEIYKSVGIGYATRIVPRSVYWRDHIMIQLVECIRTRSKYRMRHLGQFETYRHSKHFIPSTYPLHKINILYD